MKGRLERAGFKVSSADPALALERKKAARRQDLQIWPGRGQPEPASGANSLFGGRAKRFQIVDYGGLNE